MRKIVLFMHVSLDGFVAGPNGEMDWILVNDDLFDYAKQRTDQSDTALYGRVTYDMMQSYWPTAADKPDATKHDIDHSRWFNKVTKVVVSRSMKGAYIPKTKIISESVSEQVMQLKKEGEKDILMFGSPSVAHLLMEKNAIDDYWLFVNPILIGQGIPLFSRIKEPMKLQQRETIPFPSGVVCLGYTKT